MQFSSDLRIGRNVSIEADLTYLEERGQSREPLKNWPAGVCTRCRATIFNAPFLATDEPGEFCSRQCRGSSLLIKSKGRPRLTKKQSQERRKERGAYQRDLMRQRRKTAIAEVLAKKGFQPVETKDVADAKIATTCS